MQQNYKPSRAPREPPPGLASGRAFGRPNTQAPSFTCEIGRNMADRQIKVALEDGRMLIDAARSQMISLQEELDWQCYRLYGLIEDDLTQSRKAAKEDANETEANFPAGLPPLQLGQRAFEIVMARKMAAGELTTTWFARHGSTPITELPAEWPDDYRRLVERRIELIESDPNIRLIEQPEYKRRWNTEPWESQLERALRGWLLDRLESYFDFDGRMNDEEMPTARLPRSLTSVAKLADVARQDNEFLQVGELYRDNDAAFDVTKLVAELVEAESVPHVAGPPLQAVGPPQSEPSGKRPGTCSARKTAIDARTTLAKDRSGLISGRRGRGASRRSGRHDRCAAQVHQCRLLEERLLAAAAASSTCPRSGG